MDAPTRSYGGKTAQERAAERRERLVAAAIEVLAEQGAEHTTMTGICAAAGLTERYFYESFASLDEAMLAALDSVCAEIAELVVSTLQTTHGPPEGRVHALVVAFFDLVEESPGKARVAVVESAANAVLRPRRHELIQMFAQLVADEAAVLYRDQAWPEERARIHGLVFIAGLAELVGAWLTGAVETTREELVDACESLFVAFTRRDG
ncbi:TetR/AcrR family transcriptional regulator [Nocardioides pocheonensis]|uniref:TetR/AcrR family transcriptional regulator n=1 Tax=Nocardioides pocheonensis TaxID=661485 RepID=A0A3N0GS79_9ACTN|nr:TetR/AcrR family transcriptional regulator [Nocardioides pocheonensis]RNM14930.1 TetR/AcrR family transcriptional regulator [Nocardioides pocheonensis]